MPKESELEIEIETYPNETMAIVFGKMLRKKFENIFKDKPVNISVGVSSRKILINLEIPKQDYIT